MFTTRLWKHFGPDVNYSQEKREEFHVFPRNFVKICQLFLRIK